MKRCLAVAVILAGLSATARAENWPAWRGPTGQGFSSEKNVPLTWSVVKDKAGTKTENVKWKVSLAHPGNSTPVVWGDHIFVTQANKGGSIRSLLCFARADGKLLWQKDVPFEGKEQNWNENWYANASPTTDGERVIVSFASAGMYCYDFNGKELWKRTDLGTWQHQFGNASSPVLYGDTVILWVGPNSHADDPDKTDKGDDDKKKDDKGKGKGKKASKKGARNFLLAADKKTGKTLWEHDEANGSWGTPPLVKINDQDQLLLSMVPNLKGIDPKSGKELWRCEGLTKYVYTSPIYGNGVAVAMSGYGGAALAVKVGGSGDITADRLWHHPNNTQRVGTGMVIGDHVYIVNENGTPYCYELKTGTDVWKVEKRPGGGTTWGSMVHAEGRLYVLMRDGETLVFRASPKYELLAQNSLGAGEQTNSSVVISNGDIFLRTFKNLYCISAN